jgi:hypothetical protein
LPGGRGLPSHTTEQLGRPICLWLGEGGLHGAAGHTALSKAQHGLCAAGPRQSVARKEDAWADGQRAAHGAERLRLQGGWGWQLARCQGASLHAHLPPPVALWLAALNVSGWQFFVPSLPPLHMPMQPLARKGAANKGCLAQAAPPLGPLETPHQLRQPACAASPKGAPSLEGEPPQPYRR